MDTIPSMLPIADNAPSMVNQDTKVIIVPNYGKDVSKYDAMDLMVVKKVTHTVQNCNGVRFHVAEGLLATSVEFNQDSSSRLSAFMLRYPALLYHSATKSDLVLHLDCGHGFCGIVALQLGYTNTIFADTRADVMEEVVWPNILINSGENAGNVRCIASSGWMPLSEYLSDPGPNKWTVIYKRLGLVVVTVSSINNTYAWEKLHSLLLRHLTGSGIALVGLHTAIRVDTPLPVPPYLRLCFEHALLQSPACEGTHMCDIVRIARRP